MLAATDVFEEIWAGRRRLSLGGDGMDDGIIKPLDGEKCGKTPERAAMATTIITIALNKGKR